MSIQSSAMVVNLQISLWYGHKLDRGQTLKLTTEANAAHDAARVNKHLISKDHLSKIVSVANAMRALFYTHTLPWKDSGDRLLPKKMFQTYMDKHADLEREFKTEVTNFIENVYPVERERAAFRMGALFNESDYPSPADLAHRFATTLEIDAVTMGQDFRVEMDEDQVRGIRTDIEYAVKERMARAAREPWERLCARLEGFQEHLGEKKVLRTATFDNLAEVAELLPMLNFLDDPQIDVACQKVRQMLTGVEAGILRKDTDARAAMSAQVNDILATMRGFMQAA